MVRVIIYLKSTARGILAGMYALNVYHERCWAGLGGKIFSLEAAEVLRQVLDTYSMIHVYSLRMSVAM